VIGQAGACLAIAIVSVVHVGSATASSSDPLDERTGAPAALGGVEPTCVACHSSFALNSGAGLLSISAPEQYEPGVTYEIQVSLEDTGRVRWGFEMTSIDDLLAGAGSFAVGPDGFTQISMTGDRDYIKQTSSGTADGQADQNEWTFSWTAPDLDIGPVTLYAAGVAADSTGGSSGDDVYSAFVTVPEPAAPALQLMASVTLGVLAARRRSPCNWQRCSE
jgi:hypothetical protein